MIRLIATLSTATRLLTGSLSAVRDYLREPVNAAKEPRWKVAVWSVAAVPVGPVVRAVFGDATRGGW